MWRLTRTREKDEELYELDERIDDLESTLELLLMRTLSLSPSPINHFEESEEEPVEGVGYSEERIIRLKQAWDAILIFICFSVFCSIVHWMAQRIFAL